VVIDPINQLFDFGCSGEEDYSEDDSSQRRNPKAVVSPPNDPRVNSHSPCVVVSFRGRRRLASQHPSCFTRPDTIANRGRVGENTTV